MQHHAVGHDRAELVADGGEPASADLQPAQIAGRQEVGETQRVGAAQLGLAFGADVPQGHPLHQCVVVLPRVAPVVQRHVHVVVDHELDSPELQRALEVG